MTKLFVGAGALATLLWIGGFASAQQPVPPIQPVPQNPRAIPQVPAQAGQVPGQAGQVQGAQGTSVMSDQTFADKADIIDRAEVKLAKLALEKTNNPAVRKFADRMIHDHEMLEKQMTGAMNRQNMAVPEKLDPKHQALYDQLSKLQGAEFDRAYADTMVKGHEKAIQLFENEIQNGQNPTMRHLAETGLPILKTHLELAEQMKSKVGG